MTAIRTTNARTSNASIDGRDEGADGDGFLFDNCDSFCCEARWFKGAAAVLTRSTPPAPSHPDMPTLAYFSGRNSGDGVIVSAVDWKIDNARINGTTRHGFDVQQGNLHETFSKIYGTDIGIRVRPNVALCNFQGTESSDNRIGVLIQGNETTVVNWFGEHNKQCGMLVGAKSILSAIRINSDRDILSVLPAPRKPTLHLDFANRTDTEFGPLCANWSTLIGAHLDVLPGDTAAAVNAHRVTISDLHVNGEPNAIALQIDQPVDSLRIRDMSVCGPAIVINNLGSNCDLSFLYHQTKPRVVLPNSWNPSNKITFNGVPVLPGKAA